MQSNPLRRTRFGQYQASSSAVGWPRDGDCYLMHKMQSGGWPYHTCQVSCMYMYTCVATNSPELGSSLHLIVIATCMYVLLQTNSFVLMDLEFHCQ